MKTAAKTSGRCRRYSIRVIGAVVASLLTLALSACAMSYSALINANSGQLGCETNAGVYYLGQTFLRVIVNNTAGTDNYYLAGVQTQRRVDRKHGFCLDYRSSLTAEEAFIVKKTDQGLLKAITSNSDDKSVDIAKTLIQTFFVGLSGNAAFPSADAIGKSSIRSRVSATQVVDQVYDPYHEADTALLNNSIKDYGFCLVIEEQVFNSAYKGINDYCDAPLRHTSVEDALKRTAKTGGPLPSVHDDRHGIFYRPRRTRTIYLYIKQDLLSKGGWKLRASQAIAIENTSPVMFVGIDRTFFATRKTTALFDDGALTDITIKKDSELAGFVQIPLYIAQSVVALPAQIIQVRIDQTNQRQKLITARENLIKAETALIEAKQKTTAGEDPSTEPNIKANIRRKAIISKANTAQARCREMGGRIPERCKARMLGCINKHGEDISESELLVCLLHNPEN